jgi:hypothetical protein
MNLQSGTATILEKLKDVRLKPVRKYILALSV